VAVGITVGIGIIELTGAATQNSASVAGTATTGLHAGIHWRTNKDVRQVLAALRANGGDRYAAGIDRPKRVRLPRLSSNGFSTFPRAR
jgi:hypothetical protein